MFKSVKNQVKEQFDKMVATGKTLFVTDTNRDAMWDVYLNGFESEEERQHHNCNCCRQFIKNYGKIVIIEDGKLTTVWDFVPQDEVYTNSINGLSEIVKASVIQNRFINDFLKLGTDSNFDMDANVTWNHFFVVAPTVCLVKKDQKDTVLSQTRDNKNVFKRALEELTMDATETVLELIAQGSLYRGSESENLLKTFLQFQKDYNKTLAHKKDNFIWSAIGLYGNAGIFKIRNTAIGTLLVDLSGGRDLDSAVTAFEKMVAPTNYKRPTALITQGMIKEAEKAIEDMGLKDSLGRRFATPEDISVDNVIFVNRDAKVAGNVFEEMKEEAQINPKSLSKVEEITIDKFIEEVLPTAKGVEVLVENAHLANLVSVIAPVEPSAPGLFKWDNPYSWSYVNALTDSIKERVKAAGGNVEGVLRVSLSWFNYDDLDLHVMEPSGNVIKYSTFKKPAIAPSSGQLDVDMNAGHGTSRTAVENITWSNASKMQEGDYSVYVNQYALREAKDFGCIVEIECNGEIFTFERTEKMEGNTGIVKFNYSKANGITISGGAESKSISKEKWGINTNKFQKVSMIMNSPNYWTDNVGNKHVFFMIEGAKNDETPRGFFNEFLKEDLTKNRRVFEVLGAKLKVEPSDKQLTGVGFSTTQRNHIICRVEGKFKRTLKVTF